MNGKNPHIKVVPSAQKVAERMAKATFPAEPVGRKIGEAKVTGQRPNFHYVSMKSIVNELTPLEKLRDLSGKEQFNRDINQYILYP